MRLHGVPPYRPVATSHVEKAQECMDTAAWKAVGYEPHEGETSRESRVSSTESGGGPAVRGGGKGKAARAFAGPRGPLRDPPGGRGGTGTGGRGPR